MTGKEHIIKAASECLGTPFMHQGRVLGVGLDCAGVLVHVFQRCSLPYEDLAGYPPYPYKGMLRAILDRQPSLKRVPSRELSPGAVLLMRIKREPQHIAIYTGNSIIHSYSSARKVVEQSLSDDWRKRILQVYSIVWR